MASTDKSIVRQLEPKDINLFQELVLIFEDVFEMQNCIVPNQNHLQNLLGKPDFIVFAALLENKVIGGLTAYILTSYFVESSDVYILDIAIKPEFQRMGLGKRIMKALIEHCKKQNMNEIFVQADETDPHAIGFYHSLGGISKKAINFDFALNNIMNLK